jgi:serine/threonine protein phosphatase PrpC
LGPDARRAAGATDRGLQREVNEDRFHVDVTRGLFIIIDGVGGKAAGGKAADVALSMLRDRLERETGPISERIREAIAIANNEIYRLASTRPEWDGMACVLTVAVVKDGKATIGHVGDTRLYKLRENRIQKITRDHSPIGEREDAKELSEFEAMRHPRRNEVYRDVGSEPHDPGDPEFVDLDEIPFESDAALLTCSDGLTDLVDSSSIAHLVRQSAGDPEAVVQALIEAANTAGGKDNVTVVYVEGERFATSQLRRAGSPDHAGQEMRPWAPKPWRRRLATGSVSKRAQVVRVAIVALILSIIGFTLARTGARFPFLESPAVSPASRRADGQIVQRTESIAAAIERAEPGSQVIVEPGEYREQLILKDNVRVVSRVPRGATLRLPSTASDAAAGPAVVAADLSGAELVGFRIVGDAATPLGVGVFVTASALSIVDVEIIGATTAGIDFSDGGSASLVGSEIHDNPGAAIVIRAGATPRITHNVFRRNGMSEQAPASFIIENGAGPLFRRNVFVGLSPDAFALGEAARALFKSENWFLPLRELTPPRRSGSGPSRGTR